MRVATFNVQNMRLRIRDGRPVLDGAADRDSADGERSVALSIADRRETANVIASVDADVVLLQEVFDLTTLDHFHDTFLLETGTKPYPFRYCLPGNDGHGLNVAALSRGRPRNVVSHARLTGGDLGLSDLPRALHDQPVFRRDCLELDFETVCLFACHLKAPYPDEKQGYVVREAEARAVRKIVEARFPESDAAQWMILGDLNEPAANSASGKSALSSLQNGFSIDLFDRIAPDDAWTYEVPETGLRSHPDRILVSPRLAEEYPDVSPRIVRFGMGRHGGIAGSKARENPPPHASDHALVCADFPGL